MKRFGLTLGFLAGLVSQTHSEESMGQGDIPVDIGEVQNAWQIGPMKGDDPQLLNLPQLPTLDDIIKIPVKLSRFLLFLLKPLLARVARF